MNASFAAYPEIPRWVIMWVLVAVLFYAGKALIWTSARLRPAGWQGAGWWLLWPGMDVERWTVKQVNREVTPVNNLVAGALMNMLAGAGLLWGVARAFDAPMISAWVAMIGLIFMLHFGIMHLLSAFWQAQGMSATAVMKNPAASTSLTEFWGRRWNIAFRDLAHQFVFRPVALRWGHTTALWMTFLVSGLAHEVVISIPAGAGFGLPTIYFLIQAVGISLERTLWQKRSRPFKWLLTHGFTLLPLGLLFHPPFVQRVMLPFFHALGALP